MLISLVYIQPRSGSGFCDTRTLPRFPGVSFIYNIIEVICVSQKSSYDVIAIAATQRTHCGWSVSKGFPPSSPFTKNSLTDPLKLFHGFKQVIFVQRTLGFVYARSMTSSGRFITRRYRL